MNKVQIESLNKIKAKEYTPIDFDLLRSVSCTTNKNKIVKFAQYFELVVITNYLSQLIFLYLKEKLLKQSIKF